MLYTDLGRDPTVLAFIEPYLPVSSPYLQLNKGDVLNLVDRYNDDFT